MSSSEYSDAASRLCTACGMCCNGVLFHIVRLQPTDSPKELEALGAQLSRKKREPYFKQPCSFLKDCTCGIYEARPMRCRLFECQQLKRLANDETTESEAMAAIDETKRQVAKVEALLEAAGNAHRELPLTERYDQVMVNGTEGPSPDVLLELVQRMQVLADLLNAEFRLGITAKGD